MAVRGGGPSRRSHTKSRKGCKTCKRRHIRCDESFPQCRNCTKHHVRCDYMDATTPEADAMTTASSEHASTSPTPIPTSDDNISFQHRPDSVYSDLSLTMSSMDPEAQYGSDPQLISNLYAIVDNLDGKGVSDMTTWAANVRCHLSLASSSPCVLDALKGFSASQIAFVTQSPAAREQSLQYCTAALSGLHQAVGHFSKDNSDSVLITALLLLIQSRDWLSWSSLLGGLSSITASIETWLGESRYADIVGFIKQHTEARKRLPNEVEHVSDHQRADVFKKIHVALQTLRSTLNVRPIEAHWVDQMIDLITRLQNAEPARTIEAEFNHLYILRKWIFWVPVLLLQDGPIDMLKLATIAHLYSLTLALEPVFPRLVIDLCGTAALGPLVCIITRMEAMKARMGFFELADATTLMQFPQEALATHEQVWSSWPQTPPAQALQVPNISMFFTEETNMPGNLSPAFTPVAFMPAHSRASSNATAYLEVPVGVSYNGQAGFSQNISPWGSYPSPGFPTRDFLGDDDLLFSEDEQSLTLANNIGGYIQPCEIWT
ncbi:hypothetical protein CAC42_7068 [Sphaceloma murrayae]|uniref:Zn(2)-C6 fungal-type domain-containing protein n=1 Tax=Sphaceloma murrayae TaxID=2082308 RepID=A0A2K1QQR4_9PEZI|nr:hypothetical protein CAC42_7068 [Sphaceloma murrayae]